MIPLPDLLYIDRPRRRRGDFLEELLELAFLGRNESAEMEDARGQAPLPESSWKPDLFTRDVFLNELLEAQARIEIGGTTYFAHTKYLQRVLSQPPGELEAVVFRQEILREMEEDDELRVRVEQLYSDLVELVRIIRSAHTIRFADNTPYRLRVLSHARATIDRMATDFAAAKSGLKRLSESGKAIQATSEYRILADLLDYESDLARLTLSLRVGADGRIKKLQIEQLTEDRKNRFYKTPLRRWREMLGLYWRGYGVRSSELVNRVIVDTYLKIVPSISRIVAVMGDLEVYLTARAFADRARQAGLDVCLPEMHADGPLSIEQLFNPLLLEQEGPTVPCHHIESVESSITLVTGPNSGGKTRLLQGICLAQMLGQSGLYVPGTSARLPMVSGLFASLMHLDRADQLEGRLGTELLRIRTLFRNITPRSLVMLDELCSGTNPSEAAEIVLMVMRLLSELAPFAFVTTHFLDLARQYEDEPPLEGLKFLQVDMAEETQSTYQFIPGVAATSMAAETARRLGVDFEQLSEQIHARLERQLPPGVERPEAATLPEEDAQ